MKITIEVNGMELVVTEDMFDQVAWSIPCDVYIDPDGRRTLGRAHLALTGQFKEGVRPEWKEK